MKTTLNTEDCGLAATADRAVPTAQHLHSFIPQLLSFVFLHFYTTTTVFVFFSRFMYLTP